MEVVSEEHTSASPKVALVGHSCGFLLWMYPEICSNGTQAADVVDDCDTYIPRYLVLETEAAKTRKRRPGREPNEQERSLSPLWMGCSRWKRDASKTPFRDFRIHLAESCCVERRGWNSNT